MLTVQWGGGGGSHTESNWKVIEDLMEDRDLVCMNDGRGTRVKITTGTESALDITLVSNPLAGVSYCEVLTATTVGSNHYLVSCLVGKRVEVSVGGTISKWVFGKADWDKFQKLSEETMTRIDISGEIDTLNNQVTSAIIMAADGCIPRSKNKIKRKLEECRQAVRNRNRALRQVKRTSTMQHLIHYKKAQAVVRRMVRQAKRASWRNFCNKIRRPTPVGEVWGLIKKMGGDRREWEYPVMTSEEVTAVSNRDKAEIMAKSFTKIHSSENVSEDGRRRRETTMNQHPGVLDRREEIGDITDKVFTLAEMVRAINRSRPTSPGKDQVCYVMLKYLGEGELSKLLYLYITFYIECGRRENYQVHGKKL